ncbi:MAG: ABC transporter ATP-binding protein [Gemmatimonadaceae bacterium]|nr:ABC transporter ATP-binding protein [Gloeobacterales cyanobacterium ES-bin-141]
MTSAVHFEQVDWQWPGTYEPLFVGFDFEVEAGLCMVLGGNGSGKSTLLRLAAGLITPQRGTVHITRPAGYVFQNPDHQIIMPTVEADVSFGLAELDLDPSQVRERTSGALAAVGLGGLERRPVYALSGGQKQRLVLAGTLAQQCRVLLLDEPTALLDPESQLELVRMVRGLVDTCGLCVVWVTHRLEELDYADRAVLIERGRLAASDTPARIRRQLEQQC